MSKKLDLTNQKFWKLTAIEPYRESKDSRCMWKFLCECGNTSYHVGYRVKNGDIRSCGCDRKGIRSSTNPLAFVFRDYQWRAKKKNLDFNLSFDDFINLIQSNCFYCGVEPQNRHRRYSIKYNGVDRVDNNLGYITENCVPCCIDCNVAKMERSQKQFVEWINKVYNHIKKQ